ncbi:MAG: lipoate--protein ligase family protein [Candidatus Thermoplasmatota archaeon]|nr:lipoate--protein ligase family protein [Candidatus Thermoplasmatota archaeon]
MAEDWRLLEDDIREPKKHFAVEETLLRSIDEDKSPDTLRLRRVEPSVFIGIYQDPNEAVDLKYCDENDIPVIRRPNPGGAVYQDEGTFCYSLFFRKKKLFSKLAIEEASDLYRLLGDAVIKTLDEFDVDAEISGINDVVVNGKKIYGSAQIEWYSSMVHSGTFLVDVDKNDLDRTLTPNKMKFEDKDVNSVKNRVVNLSELIDHPVRVEEVMEILADHISSILEIDLKEVELSDREKEEVEELYQNKYSLESWTYQEQQSRSATVSTKGKGGVIVLSADIEGEVIKEVSIKGDFIVSEQDELDRVIDALSDTSYTSSLHIIDNSALEEHLKRDLKKLVERMVKRHD